MRVGAGALNPPGELGGECPDEGVRAYVI